MPRKFVRLKLPLCIPPLLNMVWQLAPMNLQNAPNDGMTLVLCPTCLTQRVMVPERVILLVWAVGLALPPYSARSSAPTSLSPLTLNIPLLAQKGPNVTGALLAQAKQTLLLFVAPWWTTLYNFRQEPFALTSMTRAFRLQHRCARRPAKKDPFELSGLSTNPPWPATMFPPTGRLETLRRSGPFASSLITPTLNGEGDEWQPALLAKK